MKKTLFMVLLSVFAVALVACGSGDNGKSVSSKKTGNQNEGTNENGLEESSWAKEHLGNLDESDEELYEKAKEEGQVVIYAKGSKFKDVKTTFEAKYPGITVEPYKLNRMDLREKLTREQEAGIYNVDLVHTDYEPGLLNSGIIHNYKPNDIASKYADGYQDDDFLVHYMTVSTIIYNSDVFDEPPITNWWDLTEPEWKGKVLLNDPVSNATYSELMVSIIQNADEMAEAYKEKYGEEIELTEEDAGYEFIKRFLDNDPVLMSSGEDIIESVGNSTSGHAPIGFTSSSKLRHIEQSGLPINGIFDVSPRVSVKSTSILYLAEQAPNPNAAKLMFRFTMGGSDGTDEGLVPFNLYGSWVPRTDTENPNPFPAEDINAWTLDQDFYDKNFPKFRNYWITNVK